MLIIRRFAAALLVIFGVSVAVFVLTHIIPGDPVEVMLGERASTADRAALAKAYGLDRPVGEQMVDYYRGLMRFDLGDSLFHHRPVVDLIAERVPATVELAAAAMAIALVVALVLGIISAWYARTWVDQGARVISLLGVSIPNFWLGPLLILAGSVYLGWFPVSGRSGLNSLVLPAITLGTALAAIVARMLRNSLLEIAEADFVRTARAKGLGEWTILWRHSLRNALLPVVTLVGLQVGAILGGSVIVETVFSWPGIGRLTVEAIQSRDYPVVQGCVLLIATLYVVVNLMTDVAYGLIDPRIRLAGS
ncbi:MAG: glutathione ABC transporter permease GsiC [Gammaproteobacteria bacterium]|nr:MAG: glutathione ABC transporter permease GsiC [Gammaproteobacteria bacterium]